MWDAEKYPFMETTKSTFLTYMMLAREPKTQIAGITLLGDMEDMTKKHAPGNWTEVKVYSTFMRVGDLNLYSTDTPTLIIFLELDDRVPNDGMIKAISGEPNILELIFQ